MGLALRVLIVGGGAAGIAVAWNLLTHAQTSMELTIAEPSPDLGLGVAYGVTRLDYLLNVPAGRMGLSVTDPDHFSRWAGCSNENFMPRRIYGDYLKQSFHEAKRKSSQVSVSHLRAMVSNLKPTGQLFEVVTDSGYEGRFDYVVLALGQGSPIEPAFLSNVMQHPGYVNDVWRDSFDYLGPQIACLGTGLTFVDQALAILRDAPEATVLGFSRNGLLPETHLPKRQAPLDVPASARRSIGGMVNFIDRSGDQWRAAQDGVRHELPRIWHALPANQKQRFLDKDLRWWNVRRHRISPQVEAELQSHISDGRIQIVDGEISDVKPDGGQFVLTLGSQSSFRANQVLNCFGYQLRATNPLLMNLLQSGVLGFDDLGLGPRADLDTLRLRDAQGRANSRLFGLGPILVGEFFETTAMPEIREQAHLIADQLLAA